MTRTKIAWWQLLRIALIVGWITWAALTWWTTPREASLAHARQDIAADRVVDYQWGSEWRKDSSLLWPSNPVLESGAHDRIFLWETPDGRSYYTDGDDALHQATTALNGHHGSALPTIASGLAIAGVLLTLWALLSTDPVTGTKWFWFWILTLLPFGVGLLWWLARERPWARDVRPREKRHRWYAGIGYSFLAGLGLSIVLMLLRAWLGDGVMPIVG
ncbi:hypothetical protein AB0J80_34840 [Actinoplanes sp. NPDC049548]|uniref:hypothetical protein n=1 Tax=Actinoplanes sp. NPDC049548 TaxID=3155152 RepID=UPI003419577D